VTVWWVAGDADRQLQIVKPDGTVVEVTSYTHAKNDPHVTTFEVAEAGEYFISSPAKSNYVFRVEVAVKDPNYVPGADAPAQTTVTMKHSETTTTSLTEDKANNATLLGFDSTIFAVEYVLNDCTAPVGLNKKATSVFILRKILVMEKHWLLQH
jgi:hypothetical protein